MGNGRAEGRDGFCVAVHHQTVLQCKISVQYQRTHTGNRHRKTSGSRYTPCPGNCQRKSQNFRSHRRIPRHHESIPFRRQFHPCQMHRPERPVQCAHESGDYRKGPIGSQRMRRLPAHLDRHRIREQQADPHGGGMVRFALSRRPYIRECIMPRFSGIPGRHLHRGNGIRRREQRHRHEC